jgi:GNAT superfamily N-acetyltransferase
VALEFRPVALDQEPAVSLAGAMRDEMRTVYDDLDIDSPVMPAAGPLELGPPGGTFLVGFAPDGTPVACGGVKRLDHRTCEIKRMFVAPEARGRGHARELLVALEDAARALGYALARLDTGPRQPQAEAMYRRAGYAPIDNFNANPVASFWGEKPLSRR